MTMEPEFFKRLFQRNIEDQAGRPLPKFIVTVVNEKETGEIEFCPLSPTLEQ